MNKRRLLMLLFSCVLAACAATTPHQPVLVGDTLLVDHQIIVPEGGFLFSNGAMIGGGQ